MSGNVSWVILVKAGRHCEPLWTGNIWTEVAGPSSRRPSSSCGSISMSPLASCGSLAGSSTSSSTGRSLISTSSDASNTLDILTAEQVAELLHCTPETVREKTPHIIPGAKFGRDWVYSREMVVKVVERESMVVRCVQSDPPASLKAADVVAYRDKNQVSLGEARRAITTKQPPSLKI